LTTLDPSKAKRPAGAGFFTLYKPGQGKWVRWSTVAAMAVIVAFGAKTLAVNDLADREVWVQAIAGTVFVLLGALLTWWLVNSPRLAEFMIMTESEMRKVSWPSRREVFSSTKIVIVLTLLLGLLLYLVDVAFLKFFIFLGIA
jgi:preprotein translocase subunit SecE